jgi:hypothetical protein
VQVIIATARPLSKVAVDALVANGKVFKGKPLINKRRSTFDEGKLPKFNVLRNKFSLCNIFLQKFHEGHIYSCSYKSVRRLGDKATTRQQVVA